jgi:hypothetical protein
MNAKHTTRIITAEEQIPDGFVPVSHFRENGFVQRWSTIAKAISEAHSLGRVRAVKLCRTMSDLKVGPVYVHEGDTAAYLAVRYPHHEEPQPPVVETPVGTATLQEAVERLIEAVNDLTAAVRLKAESTLEEAAS